MEDDKLNTSEDKAWARPGCLLLINSPKGWPRLELQTCLMTTGEREERRRGGVEEGRVGGGEMRQLDKGPY